MLFVKRGFFCPGYSVFSQPGVHCVVIFFSGGAEELFPEDEGDKAGSEGVAVVG